MQQLRKINLISIYFNYFYLFFERLTMCGTISSPAGTQFSLNRFALQSFNFMSHNQHIWAHDLNKGILACHTNGHSEHIKNINTTFTYYLLSRCDRKDCNLQATSIAILFLWLANISQFSAITASISTKDADEFRENYASMPFFGEKERQRIRPTSEAAKNGVSKLATSSISNHEKEETLTKSFFICHGCGKEVHIPATVGPSRKVAMTRILSDIRTSKSRD